MGIFWEIPGIARSTFEAPHPAVQEMNQAEIRKSNHYPDSRLTSDVSTRVHKEKTTRRERSQCGSRRLTPFVSIYSKSTERIRDE